MEIDRICTRLVPDIDELIHQVQALAEKDTDSIRELVRLSIEAHTQSRMIDIVYGILMGLYGYDSERLKRDISRQSLLKGTTELSNQERLHCLSFLWRHLSGFLNEYDSLLQASDGVSEAHAGAEEAI